MTIDLGWSLLFLVAWILSAWVVWNEYEKKVREIELNKLIEENA